MREAPVMRSVFILGLLAATGSAWGACTAQRFELPVTMFNLRPIVIAKINGEDARFVLDSGDWYSQLTPAAAAHFGLRLESPPFGLTTVTGVGGETAIRVAWVKSFALSAQAIHNVEFLVGGNELGFDAVGLLGQNVLHIADDEYDLANGAMRLITPKGCGRDVVLAYWLTPGQPYSVLRIEPTSPMAPHTRATAFINGKEIRVEFDTGASTSLLSRQAAERGGFKVDAAGVVPAGTVYGVGHRTVQSWIAPFDSFKIGNEEVLHTRLRIADQDFSTDGFDMLLGDDFFLSHRIYVATSQDKLYFTYNGGGVFKAFNVAPSPAASKPTEAPTAPAQSTAPAGNVPADAADFSRRGGALMARHEYPQAIVELTRACELAPNEPLYFYQRAVAYLESQQGDLGKTDLDHAIELKPDYLDALMIRIQLRLRARDAAGASADLAAADHAAPKQSDARLPMAQIYERLDLLPQAITQYDLWIDAHRDDIALATALNGRCWVRALLNQDLDHALQDCDAAVHRSERGSGLRAAALDSRGLVYLRRGDYRRSISDYDEALKQDPKAAASLYGRGLAELRSGKSTAGQQDLASAAALRPNVADVFTRHGVTP
jgi:tetratricopeptide (TPR) repeat protein